MQEENGGASTADRKKNGGVSPADRKAAAMNELQLLTSTLKARVLHMICSLSLLFEMRCCVSDVMI
jgi:hypothetical protein